MTDKRLATRERYIERLLSEASERNRAIMRQYVLAKRASGLKATSLMNIAVVLGHLDQQAAGTALPDLSPAELTVILERYTRTHKPASVNHFANHVRCFYRWLHDDELPKAIQKALRRFAK